MHQPLNSSLLPFLGFLMLPPCSDTINHLRMQVLSVAYIVHVVGPNEMPGHLVPLFERHKLISVAEGPKDLINT